jgi:phage-related protein
MGGVRNIMVRAGADFSQLSQAMQRAQTEASGFGSHMESIFTRIGFVGNGIKTVFEAVAHSLEGLKEFAQEAGELDGRLSSLNARLGGTADQFIKTAQAMTDNSMSTKDIIEQGASLSAMLQASIHDKTQLASTTEQMLKNIAIVSSATGKTQQEVSERMVSALQGHMTALNALDMGIHVNQLMHEPWVKAIAGSTTAWAKLNQQQQQAIMLTYMNKKVTEEFGGKVIDDVATRMNQFNASLSNVKTHLEQAFQPILYAVLPVLTTFINYLNTALQYVTAFFQTLFNYHGALMPVTNALGNQSDAVNGLAGAYENLGKATGKAKAGVGSTGIKAPKVKTGDSGSGGSDTVAGGKKAGTGFLASFDQVHTIPEASKSDSGSKAGKGSGSAGGVGGVGGGGMPDIGGGMEQGAQKGSNAIAEMQQKVKDFVDKVKTFLAPVTSFFQSVWGTVSTYFKGVVAQLSAWWAQWGGQIVQALKNAWGFMQPIIMFLAKFIWDSIKGAIDGIIRFFEGLVEFLTGVFTGNWKAVFKGLWDMITGGLQAVWNIFNIVFIADGIGLIKKFAVDGFKAILEFFVNSGDKAQDFIGNIGKWFVNGFNWVKNVLSDVGLFFYRVFDGMLNKGVDMWNGMVDGAGRAWGWIKGIFSDAVGWFARTVVNPIINAFNNIMNGFQTGGIVGGLKAILNGFFDGINSWIRMANNIIHLIPGLGDSGIPNIPHLAKGGITNGAMMAVIGDNAGGQEVVTPLDRLQGMMAQTVAQTIQAVMSMQKGNKNSNGGDVILQIDGKQFARLIKPFNDLEQKRVGTNVRLQTL